MPSQASGHPDTDAEIRFAMTLAITYHQQPVDSAPFDCSSFGSVPFSMFAKIALSDSELCEIIRGNLSTVSAMGLRGHMMVGQDPSASLVLFSSLCSLRLRR